MPAAMVEACAIFAEMTSQAAILRQPGKKGCSQKVELYQHRNSVTPINVERHHFRQSIPEIIDGSMNNQNRLNAPGSMQTFADMFSADNEQEGNVISPLEIKINKMENHSMTSLTSLENPLCVFLTILKQVGKCNPGGRLYLEEQRGFKVHYNGARKEL